MANIGVIELNSLVKPYTRKFINEKLLEIKNSPDELNSRQRAMHAFYLDAFYHSMHEPGTQFSFRRAGFLYNDSVFSIQVRPVMGMNLLFKNINSQDPLKRYHHHNGAEGWASINKNWGIYASLRDNYNTVNMVVPEYITQERGAVYKHGKVEVVEFSEMRGGVIFSNNILSIGLVKDHFEWGNHYNGANIFTAHIPSPVHIKANIKPADWFEFNYIHAWLTSEIIDSARTFSYTNAYGTRQRFVYREKYLAANMFTFKPWKNTFFSMGNSIIYADIGLHPAYLLPVSFFKSIDHTLNGTSNAAGQNAQLFLDFSTRLIPKTHLYATLFVDEIATRNMFKPDEHSNHISIKTGFKVSGFPFNNISLTGEYTRSNPLAYQHFTPTTTYTSNHYNFGHYLRDNAEESYLAIQYEPFARFRAIASFSYARKGPDYNNIGGRRRGLPFISEERWNKSDLMIMADYQLIYNAYGRITYQYSKTGGPDADLYQHPILTGKKHLFWITLHLGL